MSRVNYAMSACGYILLAEIACGDFSGHHSVGREQKALLLGLLGTTLWAL
jgi:hypothetical protein